MPKNLKRIVGRGDLHFITFCCYQRRALLASARARNQAVQIAKGRPPQKALGCTSSVTHPPPEMIEKSFHYKLTITAPAFGAYKDTLNQSLHSTSVKPEAEMKDIRWGAIFYSHESRIGALFFDNGGRYGSVDDTAVSFNDNKFFEWLNSFSSCLR
jgi:hypothetical protein